MEKIKKKLESLGYTCNGWAKVEGTNVLDCINPYGSNVKVLIDGAKYKDDKHRFLVTEDDTVNDDLIQLAIDLTDNLSGMEIKCANGMCLYGNGEVNHYKYSQPTLENIGNRVRLSPILHMKDIEIDHQATLDNVDTVARRVGDKSVEYTADITDKFNTAFIELSNTYFDYYNKWNSMLAQTIISTTKLRDEVKNEASVNPNSPEHIELKRSINRREDFVATLEAETKPLEVYLEVLKQMTETFKNADKVLTEEFQNIG